MGTYRVGSVIVSELQPRRRPPQKWWAEACCGPRGRVSHCLEVGGEVVLSKMVPLSELSWTKKCRQQ